MEIPNLTSVEAQDLMGVGIFLLASAGIAINRALIRKVINNPKYDQVSLQLEHVIHHATLPLAVTPLVRPFIDDQSVVVAFSMYSSIAKGVFRDLIFTRPGFDFKIFPLRPQVDQFASDVAGGLLYAAIASGN